MPEVSNRKKTQIEAYRKKKNLCLKCGRFEDGKEHICYVNYVKSDMRGVALDKDNMIETIHPNDQDINSDVEEVVDEPNIVELDRKIRTIKSYREKKGLCEKCGQDAHDGECSEDFSKSDTRSDDEKKEDPRIVKTPRKKEPTIVEEITTEEFNKEYVELNEDDFFRLNPTEKIATLRPYIIVDIRHSDNGQKMDVGYLKFMTSKYKNMIVYMIGDPEKEFTCLDNNSLKKITNLARIKNITDQNLVNYMHGCCRYFGFPTKQITYCMTRKIPCTVFFDNTEGFDLPCAVVQLSDDENISLDIVKRNVLSWRI
jgi:hypothetical protein